MEHLWGDILIRANGALIRGQIDLLSRFRDWLSTEASPAGGIGPGESDRLDLRHIADSLLFLFAMPETPAALDVGSGVGLPGIPLAIARPDTMFHLLDRSARRVDLMKRATRVLDLENVQVVQGDFTDWTMSLPLVVSRAALPPARMLVELRRVLSPGGRAVLGGSWTSEPDCDGFEVLDVGSEILDQPVWILMMQQT